MEVYIRTAELEANLLEHGRGQFCDLGPCRGAPRERN
jgi:hypothetical protein